MNVPQFFCGPRLRNVWRQLACLAVAFAFLFPTWNVQTTVTEMVFGVGWVSFILAIFVTKPAKSTTRQTVLAGP